MIDPNIIVKANYNRQLVTIRVSAINSPDWPDIVSTRIELSRNANMSSPFDTKTTSHYKVRAYIEFPTSVAKPDTEVYGRVTLTKSDNTTLQKTFHFTVPLPILGTVADENGTNYVVEMMKMSKDGSWSNRHAGQYIVAQNDPHFDIMADASGEMIVTNRWTTPILVQNVTQGLAEVQVASEASTTVAVNNGDIVRVKESAVDETFRDWNRSTNPFCKGVSAHITYMPAINKFTVKIFEDEMLSENAFSHFNNSGTITSFPEGSFDLHKITTIYKPNAAGNSYGAFRYFNQGGALTSLPEGSFDTSNITSFDRGNNFIGFNAQGALTSLPEGSFDFDNLRTQSASTAPANFGSFNQNGALTSLPEGSFGFSSWEGIISNDVPSFAYFNQNGRLTSLPAGSFHFKRNKVMDRGSFQAFNSNGALTSLPEHSFNFKIGNIQNTSTYMFGSFNQNGALTSLPAGSFQFAPTCTTISVYAFNNFNRGGALTSLPAGSFNTENVLHAGAGFQGFNREGALVSLPEGSFNTDNMISVGTYGFAEFNYSGALKTLPKGSFSFNSLTTLSTKSFASFNQAGALEYLPVNSFNMDEVVTYSAQAADYPPFSSFNAGRGKLTKSETDYNPNFIVPSIQTRTEVAYYYNPDTQTSYTETISSSSPFKYYQADYFSVTYTESPAYTTNLQHSYLSGQTITFTATAYDSEYVAIPTIQTDGGTSVSVVDNGDDTYTFIMPQDDITVTFAVSLRPAAIMLVAEEAGTMQVSNKWTTPVLVKNVTQDTAPVTLAGSTSTTIAVDLDDEVSVTEGSGGTTFRNWSSVSNGFCMGVEARVSEMPAMRRFTTANDGTTAGNNFFYNFCDTGSSTGKGITSFPTGSLDISDITTANNNFFAGFASRNILTSLPTGSFDTSNITTVGDGFFVNFNAEGSLTSLPAGSFKLDSITTVPNNFFMNFNYGGALTSLPAGSFNTNNITAVGLRFFTQFNYQSIAGIAGHLYKDTTSGGYNPDFINAADYDVYAAYWDGLSWTTATIAPGAPFYYKTS